MDNANKPPAYQRVLLKLSGEALMGDMPYGIDPQIIQRTTHALLELVQMGVQLGIVVGGGNIFRGKGLTASGINPVSSDQIGMLATVMNGLVLQDALQKLGIDTRVMSAGRMDGMCERYDHRQAIRHLQKNRIVIFVAGTGSPFFTTDSAASLRAIEIQAHLMIKATKVDGIYDADPVKNPAAKRFEKLTYNEALERQLGVMDLTAIILCRDNHMPLRVLDMDKPGALMRAVTGEDEGTLVF